MKKIALILLIAAAIPSLCVISYWVWMWPLAGFYHCETGTPLDLLFGCIYM